MALEWDKAFDDPQFVVLVVILIVQVIHVVLFSIYLYCGTRIISLIVPLIIRGAKRIEAAGNTVEKWTKYSAVQSVSSREECIIS